MALPELYVTATPWLNIWKLQDVWTSEYFKTITGNSGFNYIASQRQGIEWTEKTQTSVSR